MQYDRQTVNLVFEIKRALPTHLQDDFKLASPDLVDKVKDIYLTIKKDDIKALAAQFLQAAGVDAASLPSSGSNILTRLYRGVEVSEELEQSSDSHRDSATAESGNTNVTNKPVKMYRGQVVQD